jgi:uncharacterized repeat protein (TIGR03803 family)
MIKTSSHCRFTTAVLVLAIVVVTVPAHAQFSVLYNFGTNANDPLNPQNSGVVAQGRDGNLYSTAPAGGSVNSGAVFRITPAGKLTVLYSFSGGADGVQPFGGVTLARDGNFYGTTAGNRGSIYGTVFKITPAGTLSVLYSFTDNNDGATPYAPPVQGTDGNFYGGTCYGGSYGTVYKITPSGKFTLLHQFNYADGFCVYPALVQGTDGNFYGTTSNGGRGAGTVFKITPAGKHTVLYNFDGTHGVNPFGSLIQGSDGNFYGTANGGGSSGNGVIFKITPTGTLTVLHGMNGTTDGGLPSGGLVQASDGNFYGVNSSGGNSSNCGSSGCGTIFKITPTGSFSVLYNFDATTGVDPLVALLQQTNGILYGDTAAGGTGAHCGSLSCGVFYSLNVGLGPFVSFLPQQSPSKVGVLIGILGQGFTGTTGVSFGGTPASFTVSSDTYLTATVPAGALTGSVTVTTPGGTLFSNRTFRVTPQIKSFTPTSGPVGTSVIITGVSLSQASSVKFGTKSASFTVNSDTQVTATVPSGAKTGKIGITTAGGTASSSTAFTVTVACAAGVTAEQIFTSSVHGCAGKGAHSNASALCAAGWHACSSAEWVAKFGGVTAPTNDYWTADTLWYSNTNNTTNHCAVAAAGTSGFSSCVAPNGPSMLVCSGAQPDPEGNYCNITGCGLNNSTPTEFFGGCPKTDSAGTACCSP